MTTVAVKGTTVVTPSSYNFVVRQAASDRQPGTYRLQTMLQAIAAAMKHRR